jgi:hypothetical protein
MFDKPEMRNMTRPELDELVDSAQHSRHFSLGGRARQNP